MITETKLRKIIQEELAILKRDELPLLLTPEEVAAILKVEITTLAQWRTASRGPRYIKKCGIRYRLSDLNKFMEED